MHTVMVSLYEWQPMRATNVPTGWTLRDVLPDGWTYTEPSGMGVFRVQCGESHWRYGVVSEGCVRVYATGVAAAEGREGRRPGTSGGMARGTGQQATTSLGEAVHFPPGRRAL